MEIIGYGGSSGGKSSSNKSQGGSEQANSLISRSNLRVLFLLGEGEIKGGFHSDLFWRNVLIDDVPLQNPDGSLNFQGVKVSYRPGTLTQSYISGFEASANEISVNQQLKKSLGAIVKTINSSEVNAVVFRFLFPQLQRVDTKKNRITETSVTYSIDIRVNGGSWVNRLWYTLNGKNNSAFEAFHRIDLPTGNIFDLRVTRITDDSTSSTLNNDMFWSAYTTITDAKLRYPNSALLGIVVSGDQFRSLPKVSFKGKFKKLLIPNNYDPITRQYNGVWNGQFTFDYTNNPAWIAYDLLINSRYGVGERISADLLNKWSFYAIGQYCDDSLPSREPGKPAQPRFTCNVQIRDAQDAYEVLNALASSFRGSFYWSSGTITATQDKPRNPVKLFSPANVLQDVDDTGQVTKPCFTYSYSSKTSRHTVALVSYYEPSNNFQKEVEYVEHSSGLSRYGYNPINIEAFGCTSRDEAHRLGLWTLESEQNLTTVVRFRVGYVGAFVSPGDVIEISDPLKSTARLGGRILDISPDRLSVTLDSVVNILDPQNTTVKFTGADQVLHPRNITGSSVINGKTVITVNQIMDGRIELYDMWMISLPSLKPAKYAVWSIVDRSEGGYYEITAIQYNDSIYNTVDYGTPLEIPPTTSLPPSVPNAPFNIKSAVSPVLREGTWTFDLKLSWDDPLYNGVTDPFTQNYQIEIREGFSGPWGSLRTTSDTNATFPQLAEETYFFRVRARDILDRFSVWVSSVAVVIERPSPQEPLGTVVKTKNSQGQIVLTWSDSQTYLYGLQGYRIYIGETLFATVPKGVLYSPGISLAPGNYTVKITPYDFAGNEAPIGLQVPLGDEFRPKNPLGEVTSSMRQEGLQLFWTDVTSHFADFAGYVIFVNGMERERTRNKFSSILALDLNTDLDIRIYVENTQGYSSTGYLQYTLGVGSGSSTVPDPTGSVTKTYAPDGGVVLSWTDSQSYTHFSGYRVYIGTELLSEGRLKISPSIIKTPGTYEILIKAYTTSGLQSVGGIATMLKPEDFLPPDPKFLLVQQTIAGSKQFYWDTPPTETYKDLVSYRLRFNTGSNTSWENSHLIKDVPIALLQFETALFREGTYTVLMKLVDSTGNESQEAVFTQVNLFDPVPDNVVETWNFRTPASSSTGDTPFLSRTPWQGVRTNLAINGEGDLEVIDPQLPAMFDSTFDVTTSGHLKATQVVEGNYALFYERLVQGILWQGVNDSEQLWSVANENLVFWQQFEQYILFPVSVLLDQEEYKLRVMILPSAIPGKIKQLEVFVDAPDIMSNIEDATISNLGSRIIPRKPMSVLKAVNLTLQDPPGNTAVRLVVKDKDPVLGALVEAYNSSGTRVSALVDAVLVGY